MDSLTFQKLLKKLHSLEAQHKQLQKANQTTSASTSSLSQSTSSLCSSNQSEMGEPSSPPTIRPPSSLLRPPSPSAASAQTDRTVRAVDYMKGRKGSEAERSKTVVGETENGDVPEGNAESSGDTNKRDDASLGRPSLFIDIRFLKWITHRPSGLAQSDRLDHFIKNRNDSVIPRSKRFGPESFVTSTPLSTKTPTKISSRPQPETINVPDIDVP